MGLNTRHFSSNQHYFPILLGIYDYCYYRCTTTIATSTELVKTAEHINNLQLSSAAHHSDTTTATENTFRLMAKTKKGPRLREEQITSKDSQQKIQCPEAIILSVLGADDRD